MSESSCQITCYRKNTIVSTNPGDSFKKLGEVLISTDDQIQSAVSEARAAFPAWRDCGVSKRVEHLPSLSTYTYQLMAFADAVDLGKSVKTDAKDALAQATLIDAAYLASNLPLRPSFKI
jgi:acyl-CoA reductase-like NAD-dependent aldehyde dehydrogenase